MKKIYFILALIITIICIALIVVIYPDIFNIGINVNPVFRIVTLVLWAISLFFITLSIIVLIVSNGHE